MAAANAIPVAGEIVDIAAGSYFTYKMAENIVKSIPEAKKAYDKGDFGKIGELLGNDIVTALVMRRGVEHTAEPAGKVGRAIGRMREKGPTEATGKARSSLAAPPGVRPMPQVPPKRLGAPGPDSSYVRSVPAETPPTITPTFPQLRSGRVPLQLPERGEPIPAGPIPHRMPPAGAEELLGRKPLGLPAPDTSKAVPPNPPRGRQPVRPSTRWKQEKAERAKTSVSPAAVPNPPPQSAEPPSIQPEVLPAAAGPVPDAITKEVANLRDTLTHRPQAAQWEQVTIQPLSADLKTPAGEPVTITADQFTPEVVWGLLSKAKGAGGILVKDPIGGVASGVVRRRIDLSQLPPEIPR